MTNLDDTINYNLIDSLTQHEITKRISIKSFVELNDLQKKKILLKHVQMSVAIEIFYSYYSFGLWYHFIFKSI